MVFFVPPGTFTLIENVFYFLAQETCYHVEDSGATYRGEADFAIQSECGVWSNRYTGGETHRYIMGMNGSHCRNVEQESNQPFCLGVDNERQMCGIRPCGK